MVSCPRSPTGSVLYLDCNSQGNPRKPLNLRSHQSGRFWDVRLHYDHYPNNPINFWALSFCQEHNMIAARGSLLICFIIYPYLCAGKADSSNCRTRYVHFSSRLTGWNAIKSRVNQLGMYCLERNLTFTPADANST